MAFKDQWVVHDRYDATLVCIHILNKTTHICLNIHTASSHLLLLLSLLVHLQQFHSLACLHYQVAVRAAAGPPNLAPQTQQVLNTTSKHIYTHTQIIT